MKTSVPAESTGWAELHHALALRALDMTAAIAAFGFRVKRQAAVRANVPPTQQLPQVPLDDTVRPRMTPLPGRAQQRAQTHSCRLLRSGARQGSRTIGIEPGLALPPRCPAGGMHRSIFAIRSHPCDLVARTQEAPQHSGVHCG